MLEMREASRFMLNNTEDNNLRNIWRPAFLQFVSMDCIILKEWNYLKDKLNPKNPYAHSVNFIKYFQQNIRSNAKPKGSDKSPIDEKPKGSDKPLVEEKTRNYPEIPYEVIKSFKNYVIALNIQRILSFVLIDTRKIYNLKFLQASELDIESSSLSATRDNLDRQVTESYKDSENKQIINELQSVNNGLPISSEYESIFRQLVRSIGDLSNHNTGIFIGDEDSAYPIANILGKGTVLEEKLVNHIFDLSAAATDNEDLISKCGMTKLFDHLENVLPNDPIAILNSSIFNNMLDLWKQLFTDPNPEILSELIEIIPNIENRFRTANTNSQSQIDYWGGAFHLISDFLNRSASPLRIKNLMDLSEKPLAGHCLTNFRSLLSLDINILKEHKSDSLPSCNDISGRINWLMILYWSLTDDRELGALFQYALDVESNLRKYGLDLVVTNACSTVTNKGDRNKIIPAAMFPGTFELETSSISGSNLILNREYEKEKKDDENVFKMLKKTGGREKALRIEGGRGWYP